MKKVLSFLLIATMAVGLVSCGSLEDEAQMQLRETLNEFAKNPDTFKMKKGKVIISNDSLFIKTFVGIGENYFGGHVSQKYEYIFLLRHNSSGELEKRECLSHIDDNYRGISSYYKKLKKGDRCDMDIALINEYMVNGKMSEENAVMSLVYTNAAVRCISYGRIVEEEVE